MYYGDGEACIIHSKSFHHYHGAGQNAKEGFINNWLHFDSKYLDSMMVYYQLEYNMIYRMPKNNFLTDYFQELETEFLEEKSFHRENVSITIEKILLTISRNQKHEHMISNFSHYEMLHFDLFQEIRQRVLESFAQKWTIKKMADIINISENRFSVLYKKFFNTSPIDDLLNRRINHAKTLLLDTNKTIEEIGQLCGFGSQSYFSRIFKNKTSNPPQVFRRP